MLTEPQNPPTQTRSAAVRRGIRLEVTPDYEGMSRAAAALIVAAVREKPDTLLSLPSGSSPVRVFELLVEEGRRDPRLFSQARVIKLDEWGGLELDDPASCEVYLQTRVIQPLGIRPEMYFAWNSAPADPEAECARVAAWLAEHGPIDLCLLGIGTNGHLGLNEPDESLRPGPHVARLTDESTGHGMLRGARRRPQFGLTLGMGDLLQSRQIVLLASGDAKAAQMERFFWGEVFADCPASFLWLHPAVTVIADEAALQRVRAPR